MREAGLLEIEKRGQQHLYTVAPKLKSQVVTNQRTLDPGCCTFRLDKLSQIARRTIRLRSRCHNMHTWTYTQMAPHFGRGDLTTEAHVRRSRKKSSRTAQDLTPDSLLRRIGACMKQRQFIPALILCSFLIATRPSNAQSVRGSIVGRVTDASNRSLAGAEVKLVEEETNRERSVRAGQ